MVDRREVLHPGQLPAAGDGAPTAGLTEALERKVPGASRWIDGYNRMSTRATLAARRDPSRYPGAMTLGEHARSTRSRPREWKGAHDDPLQPGSLTTIVGNRFYAGSNSSPPGGRGQAHAAEVWRRCGATASCGKNRKLERRLNPPAPVVRVEERWSAC